MQHQHQPVKNEKRQASHDMMGHKGMKHNTNHPMGSAGHDHHAMMINDFKKRFYVVLVLTIPVLLLSTMIQHWLHIKSSFPIHYQPNKLTQATIILESLSRPTNK